jgi:hypothetical protein
MKHKRTGNEGIRTDLKLSVAIFTRGDVFLAGKDLVYE